MRNLVRGITSQTMKKALLMVAAIVLGLSVVSAADEKKAAKAKPYPLKTCVVSDEPLGGDHGEPYVFVHEGREVKLCCKPCLKDFNKETAKYLKKMDEAEKKNGKK
jgi:hypothetical protein